MIVWRWFIKLIEMLEANPIRTLAVIVAMIAAINHKTLIEALPRSIPEVDNWLADMAPLNVAMTGEVIGAGACWRMIFTYFEEDGSKLLDTVNHIALVSTLKPGPAKLALPHREAYRLRLQTEVYYSDPETCLPVGAAAILKSKAIETTLRDLATETSLHNACDFTEANNCELQIK
ncbi:MAG: hypothetical protein HKN60_10090 [Rhizobiales bacterium]|nr:hypothetical protein [Hyphomicrobiales bacterium]